MFTPQDPVAPATVRPPAAGVTLEILERGEAFSGATFGDAGAYEWLKGRLHGLLDPTAVGNRAIVLLDQAPRTTAGLVEYQVDLAVLKPVDLAAGNRRLLYDVLNRGEQKALTAFCDAPRQAGWDGRLSAGNGFLMRQGYTIAWSGWQGDITGGEGLLGCRLPVARRADGPIIGPSREEFIFDGAKAPLVGELTYPAASLDPSRAALSVRRHTREPARALGSDSWRYLNDRSIQIDLPQGYDQGSIFEFVYQARDPVVMGTGLAAIRDVVSFLRHERVDQNGAVNPLANPQGIPAIDHALAFGTSQSGRVLRDLLWQGFNADLEGRRVFDGVFIDGAGSRKSFVNFAFGQPGRFSRQHEDHNFPGDGFPFTYGVERDPWTGREDGILARCQADGVTPKIIHTDSSSEYWQGRAALVTTRPEGGDLTLPDTVRVYHYASVQHGGANARPLPIFAYPTNPLSETPLNRALLTALDDWVATGAPPPPSRTPSLADGTLTPVNEPERLGFPQIPGVSLPTVSNVLEPWNHDHIPPSATDGLIWTPLVPRLDSDGHELGGVSLPAVAAPLATHTGWNLRAPGYAPGELASVRGAVFPFPATRQERLARRDPRPSLEERYPTAADYVDRIAAAAGQLRAERLLLDEDVERLVAEAAKAPLPGQLEETP